MRSKGKSCRSSFALFALVPTHEGLRSFNGTKGKKKASKALDTCLLS